MTLSKHTYEHLKKMISEGQLSYHRIYSETKLSRDLGISRTPFRDAIHRLVQEGYIDIIPSKGFRLHQLTRQDVTETFQVRSALETYCTMAITRSFTTEKAKHLFRELHSTMAKMKGIHYLENERFSAILAILHAMETGDILHIYDITLRHMDVPRDINLEDL